MSAEYQGKDPLELAKQAEKDLGSSAAVHGHGGSDSTRESGVDESVTNKFPGSTVAYGSAASGQGDNREIPLSEGGDLDPKTGKPYKAGDYEDVVGNPEDKDRKYAKDHGGEDDVRGNLKK
ncbi:hypothetical protein P153DRAFT_281124 [Dothidotthia symphoricarpi CBS 119687]|uniref:Uncharacterized protein n=1 Tax=Dothidotthia symphoricarpi CBS 119687 TaxID=1392245 RepID=A0A6A6AP80_9PLEO|nr:uncharacterized protein P153DRAFT_281124 [Dothidotthia symphoricarpi CBS 119687]KAF2133729.1 hypothetical protein P153DRAFT_281124 [Dothidotthia symphoricarpi CBS 119687]